MPTSLERATWLLHEFSHLASLKLLYVFGGGHGIQPIAGATFPPTKGIDPKGTNPKGYDCSAWQSAALWHAGMLQSGSIRDASEAPGTEELAGWGQAGPGQYYTLFVRNDPATVPLSQQVHHTVGKLTLPNQPVLWTAANMTGMLCGFFNWGSWDPMTNGYIARHYPGM